MSINSDTNPLIELKGISKFFGPHKVNDQIDFVLRPGEIHALLGENGAGKSTLMKILHGELRADEGKIFLRGQACFFRSSADAMACGIGMVHQHFMLIENFTVFENIILGREKCRAAGLFLDSSLQRREIKALLEDQGFELDLDARVEDLSVGMQQKLEIFKTFYYRSEILILDEPTAVLTPQEIEDLYKTVRNFVATGKSVILITHKLAEITMFADRCTVLRRGKKVGTFDVSMESRDTLAEMMVGRHISLDFDEREKSQEEHKLLSVKGLCVSDSQRVSRIKDLDLDLYSGEILGLAGIDGNGQNEFIEALLARRPFEAHEISLRGKDLRSMKTRQIFDAGLAVIPQDRLREAIVESYTAPENMILHSYHQEPYAWKHFSLRWSLIQNSTLRSMKDFDVRPLDSSLPLGQFSGGNQQKFVIARESESNFDVLLAVHPTRGLDYGAVEYIYRHFLYLRSQGKGILLVSFELDELLAVCDRIAVLFRGQIITVLAREDFDLYRLGRLMLGLKEEQLRRKK